MSHGRFIAEAARFGNVGRPLNWERRSSMPAVAMFRLLNGLFLPVWTAAVTVTAVTIAKLRGDHSYVTEGERFWARGLLKAWGVKVTAEHLDRLPRQGPYILMANHQSHADVPILFASLPLIPGFLAKKELARIPFLSMALRNGGHVLIDRASRNSAREALKMAAGERNSAYAFVQTLILFMETPSRTAASARL